MSRPKGSGVIKLIDPKKHDPFTIGEMLHTGRRDPVRDDAVNLLISWRGLIAQRDDCAKRLKAGEGDKRTRKRLTQLNVEIVDTWQQLGAHLEKIGAGDWNSEEPSKTLFLLSEEAKPAVFPWQKELVRLVEIHNLIERSSELSPINNSAPFAALSKVEREAAQRAVREAGRKEAARKEPERKLASEKRAKYLMSPKGRAEQRRKQADAVAEFEKQQRIKPSEMDTGRSLNVSASELLKELRAKCLTVHPNNDDAKRMVRRFVRDKLRIKLRNEQGKRTDIKRAGRSQGSNPHGTASKVSKRVSG